VKKLFSDVKGRKEVGLRTGCLEEYLRLRKRKKQETKNRIVRSSVIQMYFLPNITPIKSGRIKEDEVSGKIHMEQTRNTYKSLVEKREEEAALGRPRHRWKDNIKMNVL
jgi:hypothetical protein